MQKYKPLILCLQEHWTAFHEVNIFTNDFPVYKFHSTASDMFMPAEEVLLKSGTAWHGTTIAWKNDIDSQVQRLPIVSERFCGIRCKIEEFEFLAYTLYLPTAGQDEDFLEVLSQF